MDNSTDCTGFFTQNTDITGIGVRVAFYVQMVVIELQTWFKVGEEDILNACWVLISMSFGLMLAAIVAATQNQLSFYNAVQVQNLVSLTQVTLLCVGNSLIWGTESGGLMHWTRRKKWRHNAIVMCLLCSQYFLGGGLLTYLWVKGQRFGPNPECISSMHFYVSAWRLRGSDPFRNAKIAAFTIYISLVLGPVCQNLFMYTAVCVMIWGLRRSPNSASIYTTTRAYLSRRTLVAYKALLHFTIWILSMVFYIPPTELLIRQSSQAQSAAAQWTFGQILALIAIVPAVVELLTAVSDVIRRARWGAEKEVKSVEQKEEGWVKVTHELVVEDIEAGVEDTDDK